MKKQGFGTTKDGKEASLYTLSNKNGMEISVTDYGAHLVSVLVPDKDGKKRDVVLGFDSVTGYETDGSHFGATIGRNGNRIAGAAFELHGKTYQMAKNENGNNLHSGPDGYDYRLWNVEEADDSAVTFVLMSPDGDQGFPGNFEVSVTYTLTDENAVEIHYEGSCDQDTVVNMTNHSYFNLAGHDAGSIENQTLILKAEQFSPVIDSASIPTGEHASVKGTPMDFTSEKAIGAEIEADFEQLIIIHLRDIFLYANGIKVSCICFPNLEVKTIESREHDVLIANLFNPGERRESQTHIRFFLIEQLIYLFERGNKFCSIGKAGAVDVAHFYSRFIVHIAKVHEVATSMAVWTGFHIVFGVISDFRFIENAGAHITTYKSKHIVTIL